MLKWEDLPVEMQSSEVESYYQLVSKRKGSLIFKRFLDWVLALFLLLLTSPIFLILSIWIKLDSKGPVIYKQERVTQYNRPFKIWKFRTMVTDADKKGSLVTSANDSRITKVGNFIRRVRFCDGLALFLILQPHHSKSQYASNDPCFPLVLQISEGEPVNLLKSSTV